MAVPEVDKKVLTELESMGFPTVRATRALYLLDGLTGNSSLEDALTWLIEHEHDPDIDQMPLVTNIEIGNGKPVLLPEEMKIKAQELQMHARKKKEEEEKRMEREREKDRIQVGKEVLETKRIEEENERKRMIEFRKAEKKEEKRARENILHKLEQDKAERRQKLGLPPDKSVTGKPATHTTQEKKFQSSLSVKHTTKDSMMDCLRSLKKNHKDDDAKVKRAFQTLLVYVGNVFKNPDTEKFRKIRLNNPVFQERVGNLKGGIDFLKLCGFETVEGGKFLFLPRDKVDMGLLNTAGSVLRSAMNNPYFGLL